MNCCGNLSHCGLQWLRIASGPFTTRRPGVEGCLCSFPRCSKGSAARQSQANSLSPRRAVAHRFRSSSRRKAQVRPGSAHAAVDAFVIGFEGVLHDKDSNALREEVKEALSTTDNPYYILTKSPRQAVSAALSESGIAGIPADSPRILSVSNSLSKIDQLAQVNHRPLAQDPSNTLHYIDADPDSLAQIASDPAFAKWQLYTASWVEPRQDSPAKSRPITLSDFPELLKWGLLMGVNDGCQEYEDGTPAT